MSEEVIAPIGRILRELGNLRGAEAEISRFK